jgi:hypothetical protein
MLTASTQRPRRTRGAALVFAAGLMLSGALTAPAADAETPSNWATITDSTRKADGQDAHIVTIHLTKGNDQAAVGLASLIQIKAATAGSSPDQIVGYPTEDPSDRGTYHFEFATKLPGVYDVYVDAPSLGFSASFTAEFTPLVSDLEGLEAIWPATPLKASTPTYAPADAKRVVYTFAEPGTLVYFHSPDANVVFREAAVVADDDGVARNAMVYAVDQWDGDPGRCIDVPIQSSPAVPEPAVDDDPNVTGWESVSWTAVSVCPPTEFWLALPANYQDELPPPGFAYAQEFKIGLWSDGQWVAGAADEIELSVESLYTGPETSLKLVEDAEGTAYYGYLSVSRQGTFVVTATWRDFTETLTIESQGAIVDVEPMTPDEPADPDPDDATSVLVQVLELILKLVVALVQQLLAIMGA